jgi:hypothetical protein
MMEQSGQFGIESAQKGHQLQLQLQSNLSTCFPYLLDAKNHMNTPVYYQFLVQLMITIITWVGWILQTNFGQGFQPNSVG